MIKTVFDPYFEDVNNSYLCKKPLTEVKIPSVYFEKKMAEFVLNDVISLGLFYIYVYDNIDKEKANIEKLLLQLPMKITMCPSDIYEETIDGEKHHVLKFEPGDTFIKSKSLVQAGSNVESLLNVLFEANIPNSISYTDIFKLIINAKTINNMNFKVSDQLVALLVAECIKDPNEITKPFRLNFDSDKKPNEYNRKIVRLVNLARLNSSFEGILAGNAAYSITSNIKRHRNKEQEEMMNESPLLNAIL